MKRLTSLLVLLLCATPALADDLCEANCLIDINFVNGGYIEATEALSFTFGNGGLINTVFAVVAPMAGDTLMMNAGERIDFDAGGRLSLGDGGNLDFTQVVFHDAAGLELEASGGAASIAIALGSVLLLSGNTNLAVNSPVTNSGTILIQGNSSLTLFAPLTNAGTLIVTDNSKLVINGAGCAGGCDVISPAGGALTLNNSGAGALVIDNNGGLLTVGSVSNLIAAGDLGAINNPDGDSGSGSSGGSGALALWWMALALGLLALKHRRS